MATTPKERMVLVMGKEGIDLNPLTESTHRIGILCGSIAPSMARQVLAGGGKAEIPLSHIRAVTGTDEEAQAILDSFKLLDAKTQRPLIWQLAHEALS